MKVKLQHVAHTRSGDNGDTSNIAVFAFEPEFYDSVLSPIKLHQHGFHGCMDTEDSLHDWLERMQQARLLPR